MIYLAYFVGFVLLMCIARAAYDVWKILKDYRKSEDL